MKTLDTLRRIDRQANDLGEAIRREGQVYKAELEERLRLGLHGDDAVRHYNEWMIAYNMEHLML